jgi:hypothetical protein
MEKLYLLKLFKEWGPEGMKENGGGGDLKYNVLDTL